MAARAWVARIWHRIALDSLSRSEEEKDFWVLSLQEEMKKWFGNGSLHLKLIFVTTGQETGSWPFVVRKKSSRHVVDEICFPEQIDVVQEQKMMGRRERKADS